MKISSNNKTIIEASSEKAFLQGSVSAGSDVSLTVDDNNYFSQNDYVVVGNPFQPQAEIAKINAAVSSGQSLQVDSLIFDHADEPITKIGYDKVRLYSATTLNGAKTLVEEKNVDIEEEYTDFVIADDSSGYFFFAFYNTQDDVTSAYSAGISVSEEQSNKTFSAIFDAVMDHYPDNLPQDRFERLLKMAGDEIFAERNWGFREAKREFTTTNDVYEYDIVNDIGIEDFGTLVSIRTENQVFSIIDGDTDDMLYLNPLVLQPYSAYQYGEKLYLRLPGSETITIKYYKNTESLTSSQSETSTHLVSALVYKILKFLYITKDANLSNQFEYEYQKAIKLMKKLDRKNIEMPLLAEGGRYRKDITTPNIT